MKILAARLNWSSCSSLSAHWWTDLVASFARWTLAGAGPGFLRGGRENSGAFLGLLNQPSSDGDTGNAIGVVSFRCRRSVGLVAPVGGGAGRFQLVARK